MYKEGWSTREEWTTYGLGLEDCVEEFEDLAGGLR
jgi:hypothetical protein